MSNRTQTQISDFEYYSAAANTKGDERFAERRRIALLEYDSKLRSVITGSLLRIGCVVSAKRSREQVVDILKSGPIDGVIIALEADASIASELSAANHHGASIVMLTNYPVEPRMRQQFSSIHFLQKPFDMRELLTRLNLPERATILSER